MCKHSQVAYIFIVALDYVFEVEEFESGVDVQRDHAYISEVVGHCIDRCFIFENFLVFNNKRRNNFLILMHAFPKRPALNRTIEQSQRIVDMLYDIFAVLLTQRRLVVVKFLVVFAKTVILPLLLVLFFNKYPNIFLHLAQNQDAVVHKNHLTT